MSSKLLTFYHKYQILISVSALFILSFAMRLAKITDFKIYKDSFKLLFIAKATENLQPVSNYYPNYADFNNFNFFTPYKWLLGYIVGLVVKFLSVFGVSINNVTFENTTHFLVILFASLTVLLLFLFLYKVTKDYLTALTGGLLLALSGIQIIWSGFLIVDTLAGFLLLLFLYLRLLKKNNLVITFTLYILLYLARPEFIFIPFVIEPLNYALKFIEKKKWFDNFFRLHAILFSIVFAFISLKSSLIGRNFGADLFLWTILIVSIIIFALTPRILNLDKEIKTTLIYFFDISSALMIIYYFFNPDISRYINTLLPLFIFIAAIIFEKLYKLIPEAKKHLRFTLVSLLAISLFLNTFYVLNFKGPESKEYHTEVAEKVIDFAKKNGYTTIYVGQEEGYLWQDSDNKLNIKPIDTITMEKVEPGSLFINDPSIKYVNPDFGFRYPTIQGFERVVVEHTTAPFRVNNTIADGWFEIWIKHSIL